MDPSRTAILPIDMQAAFDAPPWPARWNPRLDANALRLLDGARSAALPIIHVRHDSVEPGSTLRAGAPGHAFRPGFEPRPGEELLTKSVNAAFIGTDLDRRLRRLGADTVVAFGLTTDMCVSTTIRVGANLGWRMVLVEDACDCFELPDGRGGTIPAAQVHAAHVATLAFEFATVTTTTRCSKRSGQDGPVLDRTGPGVAPDVSRPSGGRLPGRKDMICRIWRGWTTLEDAEAYEAVVRGKVIPDIEGRRIEGFRHIDLLRLASDGEVEFTTLMWFDDLDAVRRFMGADYRVSHVPDAARAVLARFDQQAAHHEVIDRRPQAGDASRH